MAFVTPSIGGAGHTARRAQLVAWAWRLTPVWTGVASLVLNLAFVGRQSLRAEEARAIASATGSWADLWAAVRDHESPHALYDVLLRPWLAVAGTDEWALRLPAAVCGALAVSLTCLLGARLLDRLAGVIAACVLGTSVVFVDWSQRGAGGALALAAIVAATIALVAALERPAWWRWALWGLTASIAVAVSLPSVAVVVLAHAAAFVTRTPRRSWRIPGVALGAVLVVATVSSGLVLASDAVRLRELGLPDREQSVDTLWRLIGATPVPLAVAGLGVFVLVTSRVTGAAAWKTVLLCAWLVAPVAVGLLVSLGRPAFDTGYAIAAVPALALVVAAGVVSQQRWVAIGLVVLLGLGAAFRLGEWFTGPSAEDWRGAVEAIRGEQRAGEAVVVLPRRAAVAAAYYAGAGFTIDRARGHRVWLLQTAREAGRRLELGRALVRAPRYALLEERRYGDGLWLQVWAEP